MPAELLIPQDANWDAERLAFNVLLDQRPAGIALPESAGDVADVVRAALKPYEAGRYLSFTDADVDISSAFPAESAARLRAARRTYHPENRFHACHPVTG